MNTNDTQSAAPANGVGCGALLGLYAVRDPHGHINHTTIAPTDKQAIDLWMEQEQIITPILRGTPAQSWEVFEAEGFTVVRIDVVPAASAERRLAEALRDHKQEHGAQATRDFVVGYLRLPR